MNEILENLSHYMRGAATMFYLLLCIGVFKERKESHLKSILFFSMLFMVFLILKDMVLLDTGCYFNDFVLNTVVLVDFLYIPVMALFFMEAVSPGWVTLSRTTLFLLPFLSVIAIYVITGNEATFFIMFIFAFVFGLSITVIVLSAVSERNNMIKNFFSEDTDISVVWVRKAILALFFSLFIWTLLQWDSTWAGDSIYYLVSIAVWAYIYSMAIKHKVVDIPGYEDQQEIAREQDEPEAGTPGIGDLLIRTMEEQELYLHPKITLADLASSVGTNRTYLSEYLNKSLKMTFYEFINNYRVKKAVAIMAESPGLTLTEIAEKSGFNSLSTFNRAFMKNIGLQPARYQKKLFNEK